MDTTPNSLCIAYIYSKEAIITDIAMGGVGSMVLRQFFFEYV